MPAGPRFHDLLDLLCRYEVDFILVGGVAAILHGAPVMTDDLDVVYRADEANVARLAHALAEIHALYRDPAGRRIEPDETRLREIRINLLTTDFGPFDVMQTIGDGLDFDALEPRAPWIELESIRFRLLELSAIIETKEQAGRPKDRATLPLLRGIQRLAGENRSS